MSTRTHWLLKWWRTHSENELQYPNDEQTERIAWNVPYKGIVKSGKLRFDVANRCLIFIQLLTRPNEVNWHKEIRLKTELSSIDWNCSTSSWTSTTITNKTIRKPKYEYTLLQKVRNQSTHAMKNKLWVRYENDSKDELNNYEVLNWMVLLMSIWKTFLDFLKLLFKIQWTNSNAFIQKRSKKVWIKGMTT